MAHNVATGDRMASHGDDYMRDNNRSAEGNDAALIPGPLFTRKVQADGTVDAVEPPIKRRDDGRDRDTDSKQGAGERDGDGAPD